MAKVITYGNFKGGTGKTTNSAMMAYMLSKLGYKTLLADLDPQANATSLYLHTKQRITNNIVTFDKTLMSAIADEDLSDIIIEIKDNLYLLPSFADFTSFPLFLEKKFPNSQLKRVTFLKGLIEKIKDDYDFILIDVPPTLSTYTDSALLASDYTIIVLQTQERSLVGAEAYVGYLQELVDNYDANFDILGVLPVLLKNNSKVDEATLATAKEKFGEENLFKNLVKNMERLKRYDIVGIVDSDLDNKYDIHDKRVMALYKKVTEEMLSRLKEFDS
ncbi:MULTISPECIES: ParA family protein [Carnobacteriaceae]|jgi:chromosome partitioning protein|uniref:Copy number control protein n=5 Tax=Carnobacteriaceae TaxID=186828 RepID=U5SFX4_9LACT|nr:MULTISPECIES: AAA family ATPase [Carnobacteriaceae]AGY83013.1 copy number control protein [Carnobacterium inhibens subsp. gilichinskyi]MBC9826168.1 AAA family ATPase [Carnobacterium inhibens]UDE96464.1 AAA family ATPase [Carnobacterium viridans]SDQ02619.1 Cellulose biosynthesis protein BcsQ [Carnobacterium viridans]SJN43168.1 Chromosome (plasmid) partitioning protein ParA / Sporulation initiation inhibitor protein Soj [Marinilactibacillus psychrotolerans 42ea]